MNGIYPLVMTNIAIENHHFLWENPLQWPFSSSLCLFTRGYRLSRIGLASGNGWKNWDTFWTERCWCQKWAYYIKLCGFRRARLDCKRVLILKGAWCSVELLALDLRRIGKDIQKIVLWCIRLLILRWHDCPISKVEVLSCPFPALLEAEGTDGLSKCSPQNVHPTVGNGKKEQLERPAKDSTPNITQSYRSHEVLIPKLLSSYRTKWIRTSYKHVS